MTAARILVLACAGLAVGCAGSAANNANAGGAWQVQGDSVQWRGKSPPSIVRLGNVQGNSSRFAHVAGRIVWNDRSTARVYTPANGRVEELFAEPGAHVHRGQPLLRLSSADYGQWQSDLRKAQAEALAARRADQRARDLLSIGVIAQKDAEQAEAERQSKDAELARAEAHLQQLGEHGDQVNGSFVLRSPIDGVVVDRVASVGTEVRADAPTPLYVITDPDQLNIIVDLPESLASRVKVGTELSFTRSAEPGPPGRARLTAVPIAVDSQTRTVRARGVVLPPHTGMPGEAFVQVEVPLEASGSTTVTVPSDALVLADSHYYVFAANGQQFVRRPVTISELGNPLVEVSAGLAVDEPIVIEGSLYLEQLVERGPGS